jgi:hypothetical protein
MAVQQSVTSLTWFNEGFLADGRYKSGTSGLASPDACVGKVNANYVRENFWEKRE